MSPGPLAASDDQAAAIAKEFPRWRAWQGMNLLWHARIPGSDPIVMVHDETADGLREQIRDREAT
jgi:hypothetical protein